VSSVLVTGASKGIGRTIAVEPVAAPVPEGPAPSVGKRVSR
jgi:hypothetical protein